MATAHDVADHETRSRLRVRIGRLSGSAATGLGTVIVAVSLVGGAVFSPVADASPAAVHETAVGDVSSGRAGLSTPTSGIPSTGAPLRGGAVGSGSAPAPSLQSASVVGPIVPPKNPTTNDTAGGQCVNGGNNTTCLTAINTARSNQENLAAISLPTNWVSLSSAEQMFVFVNLERTSRGEAPIPALVSTYDTVVQAGVQADADPVLAVPNTWGSIWAAGTGVSLLGAFYLWMYADGPGGTNLDCTLTNTLGCWGHRDIILANASNFGSNPTEMDAAAGTDIHGMPSYAAAFIVRTGDTPVVLTRLSHLRTPTGGTGGTGGTATSPAGSNTASGVIPVGAPQTGLGGASRSTNEVPLLLGGVALAGAGLAAVIAYRRRQVLIGGRDKPA